jgi:hypothetical protein
MFGVFFALPIASIVAPPYRITLPGGREPIVVNASSHLAGASVLVGSVVQRRLELPALLLSAWIAGTVLFLLPVVMGL